RGRDLARSAVEPELEDPLRRSFARRPARPVPPKPLSRIVFFPSTSTVSLSLHRRFSSRSAVHRFYHLFSRTHQPDTQTPTDRLTLCNRFSNLPLLTLRSLSLSLSRHSSPPRSVRAERIVTFALTLFVPSVSTSNYIA